MRETDNQTTTREDRAVAAERRAQEQREGRDVQPPTKPDTGRVER